MTRANEPFKLAVKQVLDRESYQYIIREGNPFVKIGELISLHNYEAYFDEDTQSFEMVPTEVSYVQCKGCDLCTEIAQETERIDEYKVAKVLSKAPKDITTADVARLFRLGITVELLVECIGKPEMKSLLKRIGEDELAIPTFYRYGIPSRLIRTVRKYPKKEREAFEKTYAEAIWEDTLIGFKERC